MLKSSLSFWFLVVATPNLRWRQRTDFIDKVGNLILWIEKLEERLWEAAKFKRKGLLTLYLPAVILETFKYREANITLLLKEKGNVKSLASTTLELQNITSQHHLSERAEIKLRLDGDLLEIRYCFKSCIVNLYSFKEDCHFVQFQRQRMK